MTDLAWPEVLRLLSEGRSLTRAQSGSAMRSIMSGQASPAQIAALIVALRIKGETVEEMSGLVDGMLEAAVRVDLGDARPVDIVGTGGDGAGTFNISTTASLIVAGAGIPVAKHGNRSMSSKCGSADVLETLGVVIDLPPEKNQQVFVDTGYTFFLAPVYHPAMRFAGPVRKELGIPTVFNFLGPLSNPAGVRRYALGVSDGRMAERMVGVLKLREAERALVFHGSDGLDELTLSGVSVVWHLTSGEVTRSEVVPEALGLSPAPRSALAGDTAETNAAIIRGVLAGVPGPARDVSLLNAAAGILASGRCDGWGDAVSLAADSVDSGAAAAVLERVVEKSQLLAPAR